MKFAIVIAAILAVAAADNPGPGNDKVNAVIHGANYTLDDLLDGTLDLSDYDINGVDDVTLTDGGKLVGTPSRITQILRADTPAIWKGLDLDAKSIEGWHRLLCFMGNWISGMKLIQDEGIDTYGNITCNADDTLVTDKLVDTDKGVHVTKEYFQSTLCYVKQNHDSANNLYSGILERAGKPDCTNYFN